MGNRKYWCGQILREIEEEEVRKKETRKKNNTRAPKEVPADVERLHGKASHHIELEKADASSPFEEIGWMECMEKKTTLVLLTAESWKRTACCFLILSMLIRDNYLKMVLNFDWLPGFLLFFFFPENTN